MKTMRNERDDDAAASARAVGPREWETLTPAERAFDAQWARRVPRRLDDRWEAAYDAVRARMAARSQMWPAVQNGRGAKS